MARCEQGYLCEVCGDEVEDITQSDLYLRFVIGELPPRALLTARERHLRCNPVLAQFIVDPDFPPVTVEGVFAKAHLDPVDVARQEDLVTRGYRRLQIVRSLGIPVSEYPLDDVRPTRDAALPSAPRSESDAVASGAAPSSTPSSRGRV